MSDEASQTHGTGEVIDTDPAIEAPGEPETGPIEADEVGQPVGPKPALLVPDGQIDRATLHTLCWLAGLDSRDEVIQPWRIRREQSVEETWPVIRFVNGEPESDPVVRWLQEQAGVETSGTLDSDTLAGLRSMVGAPLGGAAMARSLQKWINARVRAS